MKPPSKGAAVGGGLPLYLTGGGLCSVYPLQNLMSSLLPLLAILMGLEPTTSTVTGWRALQLLYRIKECEGI